MPKGIGTGSATIQTSPAKSRGRRFLSTRRYTEKLISGLSAEDCLLQATPYASPLKWHLAHTTWFWAEFYLEENLPDFYGHLFNSYYNSIGKRTEQAKRGLQSRPSLQEILCWRDQVTDRVFERCLNDEDFTIFEIGIQHEMQHQELMLMDIQLNFFLTDLQPSYTNLPEPTSAVEVAMDFIPYQGGCRTFGYQGEEFCFDNELPAHKRWVEPFEIGTRLVSNAEFKEFIAAGGYQDPDLWLSDGWDWVQDAKIKRPLYWSADFVQEFSLLGWVHLDHHRPVRHISFYEADAYARWRGKRLPTEFEWELASAEQPINQIKPAFLPHEVPNQNFHGVLWQHTSSHYEPYPGFRSANGALGEYNGKFMNNQRVLRGGSIFSPRRHLRNTYRNFFSPFHSWMASGIRLVR